MVLKFVEQDEIFRDFLLEALAPLEAAVEREDRRDAQASRLRLHHLARLGDAAPFRSRAQYPAPGPRHQDDDDLPARRRSRSCRRRSMSASTAAATATCPGATNSPRAAANSISTPGQAVHVPFMAPHWVRNGPEVSVSFSITWRSEWSYREEYAQRMNAPAAQGRAEPRRAQALPAPEPRQVARLSRDRQGAADAGPARRSNRLGRRPRRPRLVAAERVAEEAARDTSAAPPRRRRSRARSDS